MTCLKVFKMWKLGDISLHDGLYENSCEMETITEQVIKHEKCTSLSKY
jgi:hypothetical protein